MHDPAAYGNKVADVYDSLFNAPTDDAVAFLAGLALPDLPVLELGIGTGRLALPLARRGLAVHGVDASEAMVARLREKPDGASIPVTIGDFADVSTVGGAPFGLAFCAFNTFFALLTQEDQLRCFSSVASILAPGGHFVLEAFVPGVSRFSQPQPAFVMGLPDDAVYLDTSLHDAPSQRVSTRMVKLSESGIRIIPIEIRYAWPSELDLMARLAGLELATRQSSWRPPSFSGANGQVSAWRKPA